jgi:hypothetical protein
MTRTPLRRSLRLLTPVVVTASVATLAATPASACGRALVFRGPLQDLQPATVDPFDGAAARVLLVHRAHGTRVVLTVKGADPGSAGVQFGAHLHVGPCVAGDPAAAGPHYNASTSVPPVVSDQTEVWLDFVVAPDGSGRSAAAVPFVPVPGARSVVIHALPTDETGAAGTRLACLPVVWS